MNSWTLILFIVCTLYDKRISSLQRATVMEVQFMKMELMQQWVFQQVTTTTDCNIQPPNRCHHNPRPRPWSTLISLWDLGTTKQGTQLMDTLLLTISDVCNFIPFVFMQLLSSFCYFHDPLPYAGNKHVVIMMILCQTIIAIGNDR